MLIPGTRAIVKKGDMVISTMEDYGTKHSTPDASYPVDQIYIGKCVESFASSVDCPYQIIRRTSGGSISPIYSIPLPLP